MTKSCTDGGARSKNSSDKTNPKRTQEVSREVVEQVPVQKFSVGRGVSLGDKGRKWLNELGVGLFGHWDCQGGADLREATTRPCGKVLGRGLYNQNTDLHDRMTTRNRPEKALISLFLSAYDNDTWQGCGEEWLDEEPAKQQNRRVEILATRRSDGATLAIEHTLIQPYAVHKQESARFSTVYRAIQNDQTLIVRNRGVDVFVRSGTLAKGYDWKSISSIVHDWFRANVRTLPVGESHHIVVATGTPPIRLVIRIIEERDFDGDLKIGINTRQLRGDPLSSAIEKALKTKVGKLADTKADKRILLLERDEFALSEDLIAAKIEGKRHMIEKFDKIHEIWFAGTVPSFGASNYKRFSMYRKDRLSNSWLSIRDASAAVTVANSERFQRLVGCQLILANG